MIPGRRATVFFSLRKTGVFAYLDNFSNQKPFLAFDIGSCRPRSDQIKVFNAVCTAKFPHAIIFVPSIYFFRDIERKNIKLQV